MEKSHSAAYAAAGVDITAGYKGVKLMSADVKRTHIPGVVSDIGGFGGLFAPDLTGITEPVLVSGTDGVGTKLRLAELLNKHDTIGIDCVAMCVNDVICWAQSPCFSWITLPSARTCRKRWRLSSPAWQRAVCRRAAPSSAVRPPSTPV